MWSDSEDIAVIADMYQLNIKVISTKGPSDSNPTVNWVYPDKNMAVFAELKNVKLDDLVLLHEYDVHYNLIISKDCDLAKFGSLSHRYKVVQLRAMYLKMNLSLKRRMKLKMMFLLNICIWTL